MRIVFIAYAISPVRGTEPGNSWRLAVQLARSGHDVELLTSDRFHEEWADEVLPDGLSITIVPREIPGGRFSRNALGWYAAYLVFLSRSLAVARRLHCERPADIAHHYSFGTLAIGTPIWRLGVPTVFGPAGGGAFAAPALRELLGRRRSRAERVHELVSLGVRFNPLARTTLRHCVSLAANTGTANLMRRVGRIEPSLMCDTWASPELLAHDPVPRSARHQRQIAWVGRLIPIKTTVLALMSMQHLPDHRLKVAGDGPLRAELEQQARDLGVADRVTFLGALPWPDTMELLRHSEVMLFTSARDTFGSQLMEAAAVGTPIVALDQHGTHDFVPPEAGRLVPVHGDGSTIAAALAAGVSALTEVPAAWAAASAHARGLAESMSIPHQAEAMTAAYERAIAEFRR